MAEKIVGEYDIKVDGAIKNLDKLQKEVSDVDKNAAKSAKKVEGAYSGMAKNLTGQFKNLAGAIGLAFGAQQLIQFGKEAVKVAAQAEGIERAFARLNRPNLLSELRKATRGTVDDLTLMRQAVRAENFKVPLEQLGKFFDFATQRSIQTGESVDYLVNSIIDGIGRKSTLVLDNLGISASELQEEIKRVGDFGEAAGNIISRELEKAGDVADTTAIKIEQINTALENAKVAFGTALIGEIDNLSESFSGLKGELDTLFDTDIDAEEWGKAVSFALSSLTFGFKIVGKIGERVLEVVNGVTAGIKELAENVEIETYRLGLNGDELERFNELGRTAQLIMIRRSKGMEDYADFTDDAIKATELFNKKTGEQNETTEKTIYNLAYYNKLIKELQTEQKAANTTRERVRELEDEINEAMRQRLILLGRLRVAGSDNNNFELVDSTAARMTDDEFDLAKMSLVVQQELTDNILEDYAHRNGEIEKSIQERNEMEARLAEERVQNEVDTAMQVVQISLDTFSSIASSIAQIQQNAFIEEEQELQSQLEQGLITREKYEDKLNEIKRKQAAANKDAAIFQATISTAQAVVNALGSAPFTPLNIATAAIVGAAGAAQIAAIASQPLPQFAEGGFINAHGEIKGRSHSKGGVRIEAEGNEFITAAKYAQPNKDILKAINSGQWEKYKVENIIAPAIEQVLEGGFDNIGASMALQGAFNDKNLLKAHDRGRYAMKDGFIYLGKKIEGLNGRNNRWN